MSSSPSPATASLSQAPAASATGPLAEALNGRPELAGLAFNFSGGQRHSVLEVVSAVLRAMDSPLQPDIRNDASNEIRDQYLDSTRATALLKWAPAFTMDEGLRRTVEWYTEFLRGE